MSRYKLNEHIFDEIDTEEKAYWLGFIWCDGYVIKRHRSKGRIEYSLKVDLADVDYNHLVKLKDFLEAEHPIKVYESFKSGYKADRKVCRLYICHKNFAKTLYEKYGIIAGRSEFNMELIPYNLRKHFIRGVIDADGSLILANTMIYKESKKYTPRMVMKLSISISTYEQLVKQIDKHLLEEGITLREHNIRKRHEGRDGHCVILKLCGNTQCKKVSSYLYSEAKVYLDRKYERYLEMQKY